MKKIPAGVSHLRQTQPEARIKTPEFNERKRKQERQAKLAAKGTKMLAGYKRPAPVDGPHTAKAGTYPLYMKRETHAAFLSLCHRWGIGKGPCLERVMIEAIRRERDGDVNKTPISVHAARTETPKPPKPKVPEPEHEGVMVVTHGAKRVHEKPMSGTESTAGRPCY
ncbi:MAG: hypothetical protein ACYTF7_10600 [Planctomycetota bacterium]|jgi:hypothetical protein